MHIIKHECCTGSNQYEQAIFNQLFFWLVVLFIVPFWFCKCSEWSEDKPNNPNSWNEVVKDLLVILGLSQHYKSLEYPETYCHSYTFLSKVQGRWLHALCHTHSIWSMLWRLLFICATHPWPSVQKSLHAFMPLVLKICWSWAELRHLPRLWPWVYKGF